MDVNILKEINYRLGCGSIINIFEGLKRFLNGKEDGNSFKLYKNSNKKFFQEEDSLGRLSSDYLNELAAILINWYRVRLPDSIFIRVNNNTYINEQNVGYENYEKMSFDQLLRRNNDLHLLKCNYGDNNIYTNDELSLKIFTKTGFLNNKEDKVCIIIADRKDGNIKRIEGDYLLPDSIKDTYTNYKLDELLLLVEKDHIESLNYNSLVNCVRNRKKDIIIRNKIIDIVCLELFNSDEYEYGYYRALTFLKEISNYLELRLNNNYLNRFINDIKTKDNDNHKIKSKKYYD